MDQVIFDLIKTSGNKQLEERLKENPSLADNKTETGISLLQYAVYCGNVYAAGILRKYKPDIDIFEAAAVGDINTAARLLQINPELLHTFSPDGFTVLGLASYFGHLSLVKFLLEEGADPNITSNNQLNVAPIHSACAISDIEIAELLIENGANVNAKQTQGVTPLHSAANNGKTLLVMLLIKKGAVVNAKMDNGQTPLSMALKNDFQETAELIRSYGGQL